jgi:hypothetical protein
LSICLLARSWRLGAARPRCIVAPGAPLERTPPGVSAGVLASRGVTGPHFFAARWTCESDKHGFEPSHLPVFLCFACIGTPSHLLVFCVLYAEPQCRYVLGTGYCIYIYRQAIFSALCVVGLSGLAVAPAPAPCALHDARRPRSRSRWVLGCGFAAAVAAAVSS